MDDEEDAMPVIPRKIDRVAKKQVAQFIDSSGPDFFANADVQDCAYRLGDFSASSARVVDDFAGTSGSAPNPAIWTPRVGAGGGGQLMAYTTSTNNAYLDGSGNLVVAALSETTTVNGQTYNYTSAWLDTRGKFEFQYGTITAVLKSPPKTTGIDAALFTTGVGFDFVANTGWPQSGELDIFETGNLTAGYPQWSNIHGPESPGSSTAYSYPAYNFSFDASAAFHTYKMFWKPGQITTTFDGVEIGNFTPDSVPEGGWVFDNNTMYLIVNISVGADGVSVSDPTVFPAHLTVSSITYAPLGP